MACLAGLPCPSSRRVAFTARWQWDNRFGDSRPENITYGLYAKIRNPIYVFSGLLVLGILISLYRYALLLLLVLIPIRLSARQRPACSKPVSAISIENTGREPVLTVRIISAGRGKSRE
jgi:hypothetical protein